MTTVTPMSAPHPMLDIYPYLARVHPAQVALLEWFEHSHLPPRLQFVVWPFWLVAHCLVVDSENDLGDLDEASMLSTNFGSLASEPLRGPELTVALRKLLEAMDCAVRAAQDGGA